MMVSSVLFRSPLSPNKPLEETIELNTEEEAAFLAESLTIKRQFDEINVIETQVADIAHLTQQISENIEEQAEIADEVHQNVGTFISSLISKL